MEPTAERRAGIYVRVSRLRDDDKSLSPETQRLRCEDLARAKDFQVVRVESDLDESAYDQPWNKRPAFVRLVEAVKAGEISAIIVSRLDRFARLTRDTMDVIEILDDAGGRLICGDQEVDIETAQGKFNLNFMAGLAELESGRISERIKASHKTRAVTGKGAYGSPPMYLDYDKETKTFTVNDNADAFRLMVTMRSEGRGTTAICRALNSQGFTKATGAPWRPADAQRYLKDTWIDTMGTGAQYYHRPSHRKYKKGKEIKREATIRVEGIYPAIVSPEVATAAIAVNRRSSKPGAKNTGEAYLLQGILFCQGCGGRMKGHAVGYGRYYRCENLGHPLHTDRTYVAAGMVDDAVIRAVMVYIKGRAESMAQPFAPDPKAAERQLKVIDGRILRVNDMYEMGSLDRKDYVKKLEALNAERQEILTAAETAPQPMPQIPDDPRSLPTATLRDILRQYQVKAEYPFWDSRVVSKNDSLRPMVKVSYQPGSLAITAQGLQRIGFDCYAPIYRATWQGKREVFGDDELYSAECLEEPVMV